MTRRFPDREYHRRLASVRAEMEDRELGACLICSPEKLGLAGGRLGIELMSWVLRTGRGDSFVSDTVVVTDGGCEILTRTPREVLVR